MNIDTDKVDDAVLALLYLTLHDGFRAWMGHDWDAMDRLYRKGMIDNPVGKTKSVVLTHEGLAESERLFRKLFERPAESLCRGLGEAKMSESFSGFDAADYLKTDDDIAAYLEERGRRRPCRHGRCPRLPKPD